MHVFKLKVKCIVYCYIAYFSIEMQLCLPQVLGEYFFLKAETKPEVVLDKLGRLLDQSSVTSETKGWIMAAITKLSSHTVCPNTVAEVAQKYTTSLDTVLRQHAFELKHLNEDRDLIRRVLPLDASCEDIEVQ